MDYMTHKDSGQESDPQAGHKMSDIQATHDRHAGHSVAMFRDSSERRSSFIEVDAKALNPLKTTGIHNAARMVESCATNPIRGGPARKPT